MKQILVVMLLMLTLAALAFACIVPRTTDLIVTDSKYSKSIGPTKVGTIQCTGLVAVASKCRVYLYSKIYSSDVYMPLRIMLDGAGPLDTFVFHLKGNGGQLSGARVIIASILSTKAHVKGVLEGSVYSSHALIALTIKDLSAKPGVTLMLHHSSWLGQEAKICKSSKGTVDRGQDGYKKCLDQVSNSLRSTAIMIKEIAKIHNLDTKKINRVLQGYDVYFTAEEVLK